MFKDNFRILIVDDMPSIHQDFAKILAPETSDQYEHLNEMKTLVSNRSSSNKLPPFEFDFALQGEEGVNLVKKALKERNPYAMAFVDVQMPPGEDGVETIAKIWALDSEIQTVMCTAYAKYNWEDIRTKFGDTDRLFILKKPFDSLEVIQLASALCKKWNQNHAQGLKGPKLSQKTSTSQETLDRLSGAMDILSKLKFPK